MSLIVHAGGRIDGNRYTNSLEAVQKYINLGESCIELDVVALKDGFGVAHDGLEGSVYGLSQSFCDTFKRDFLRAKIFGRYTPLDFDRLHDVVLKSPAVSFVLDVKSSGSGYGDLLRYLASFPPAFKSKLIPQIYCLDDLKAARQVGFDEVLVSLWKFFDWDPFSTPALQFVDEVTRSGASLKGCAVRYINPQTSRLNLMSASFRAFRERFPLVKIFLHGQDAGLGLFEQLALLNIYGLFSSISPRELPADFVPKQYLLLNPDLSKLSFAELFSHYLEFGIVEGRKYRLDIPDNFEWTSYVKLNPDLATTVTHEEAALVHWTQFGKTERRRYLSP